MGEIVETLKTVEGALSHIVVGKDGKAYYVDTRDTFDVGWETMAFPFDMKRWKVVSWAEIAKLNYQDGEEATKGHMSVVREL